MSESSSPSATYGETPDEWYEREKTAFRAWWESDDNEKTFSSTPTMAAGAGWFARAEAAPETAPIVPCLAPNGCTTPEWCARNGDACRVKTPVSEIAPSDACRAALANIMARIDGDEFVPTEYKEDAKKALASFPSAIRQNECPGCKGSGEERVMTQGLGPDDYEVSIQCSKCKGTGSSIEPNRKEVTAILGIWLQKAMSDKEALRDILATMKGGHPEKCCCELCRPDL